MFSFGKKYNEYSDEQLMQLIGKGNDKAFAELYDRYSNKMHYYFYRMLYQNKEKADDFTQDLFMKLIEKANLFDSNRKLSTWLYTIAANMCKNEYRRKERNIVSSQLPPYADEFFLADETVITEVLDKKLFQEHLQNAIEGLDEIHQQCFVLRYQEELSVKEISEILNCPEGTVKSRIHYSLKKLAQKLSIFDSTFKSKVS